ncbi:hypothetical protein [Phycicoccus sp. DTK01]|uniref:hypothetical protein n=1 Tax=Phycicoccus sp. DTK01 TaxID=2785745 RepID=UPI001A8CBE3C|nr:hypothetical protein [Phycicoccus sp. DTK01]GIL37558.1 hypothetical protein PDTK01_36330 [Phycicoccus sp. DTK01]
MSDEATTDAASAPAAPAPPRVDVTKLLNEAASKSGLLWVRLPDGSTYPAWHVWHDDGDERGTGPAAYVVSGPGEQHLPWLPDEVELILRSKDTGGRLLTIHATTRVLEPGTDAWEQAAAVLRPERLNAPGSAEEVLERWRAHNTLHVLTPHGRPGEQPGHHGTSSGAAPVRPAAPATARWRPWHWRGRAGARRNTPDEPSTPPSDGG